MRRKFSCPIATSVIHEAHDLARFLVEAEFCRCHDIELAIYHCATRYGIDEGALRSLRYRWRELADVRASILERLRMAFEDVYADRREIEIARKEIRERKAALTKRVLEPAE